MRTLITAGCLLAGTLATAAASQGETNERYRDYVATYAPLAVAEMQNARIPASVTLAQGLLESGAGTSDLARESNNHFGIKCNNGWTGATHHAEDDDYHGGRLVHSCFRAYDHAAESYADHSAFLVGSSRYADLFDLDIRDYRGWARGLKSAGYATSSSYAHRLIEIIETYELYRYDQDVSILPANPDLYASGTRSPKPTSSPDRRPVLTGAAHGKASGRPSNTSGSVAAKPTAVTTTTAVQTINDVDYVTALDGETIAQLAKRVDRTTGELTRYNETLNSRRSGLTVGQRVYLQPKHDNFRGRAKNHRVAADEDLQAIADLYGITTSGLRERNHIAVGREPNVGQEIAIRGRRRTSDVVAVTPSARRRQEIEGLRRPRQRDATLLSEASGGPALTAGTSTASTSTTSRTSTGEDRIEVIELPPVSRTNASSGVDNSPQTTAPAKTPAATRPPTPARAASLPTGRTAARFVTVGTGDTLYSISRASGVAVPEIKALNSLRDNVIKPGQRLRLSR